MTATPFRIYVKWADGADAHFDVVSVNLWSYGDVPLQFDTENGLTIMAPDQPEDEGDGREPDGYRLEGGRMIPTDR